MSPFPAEPLNTASSGSVSGKWSAPVQPTPEPDTGGEVVSAVRECEHYYAWMSPAGAKKSARICMSCHWPDPAWLNHLAELDLGHDDCVHCEFGDQHVSPETLDEAVKAERERIAAAIEAQMGRDADFDDALELAAWVARTAPLQDAEEVGE